MSSRSTAAGAHPPAGAPAPDSAEPRLSGGVAGEPAAPQQDPGEHAQLDAELARARPGSAASAAAGADAARRALLLAGRTRRDDDAARAAAWLAAHQYLLGQHAAARDSALLALPRLEKRPLADERRELLRVLTLAAIECGSFGAALDAANQLVRESVVTGDATLGLRACIALAACLERLGDPWQAIRLLGDAVARHDAAAAPVARLQAHNGLAAIMIGTLHRVRDAVDATERTRLLHQAGAAGRQALALLGEKHDPSYEVAVRGNLGEVLTLDGQTEAGLALLHQAWQIASAHGLHAHRWRVEASRAGAELDAGQAERALQSMQQLLAEMPSPAPPATEIRARDVAYRACRQLGRLDDALRHLERFEQLERVRTVQQLQAQSELFVTRGEVLRAQAQLDQARQDEQAQRERAADLAHRVLHDALTGLGNRALFEQRGTELLAQPAAERGPLALAVLDVDHFKQINDRFGHAAGDAVLRTLGGLLREATRHGDLLVRLGGEEFVVLLVETTAAAALEVCERLRCAVQDHAAWPELPAGERVTLSIGLATQPGALYEWLRRADAALYEAKRAGRNRVVVQAA